VPTGLIRGRVHDQPLDGSAAPRPLRRWSRLRETLTGLGQRVELIEPVPGLPDMVFAANGATAIGGRTLSAKVRHEQRA
jgi:N-dimethylarginine dimethylaminohydrolase